MNKVLLTILSLLILFSASKACRFTVREIGFADFGTDEYKLLFFKDKNSTDEQEDSFKKISYAALLDANVKSEIVNVQQSDHPLLKLYENSGPNIQKLALVSSSGEALELEIDRTAANFKEEVWSLLENVLSSPTREKILANIVQNYGIVVIVESVDKRENQHAHEMAKKAIEEIKIMMANMPKPVDVPPQVIVVENKDIETERVLLWGLGFDDVKESLPAITVLFGRGRQMGRLLPTDIIKSNIVRNLLAFVGADCECGLDRSWILGRMIPTRWESDKQREVIEYHQFDAENPLIKAEMSQILSISPSKERTQSNADLTAKDVYGYTEKEIDLITSSNEAPSGVANRTWLSPMNVSVMVVAGLLLLVVIVGGYILFNAQKRDV